MRWDLKALILMLSLGNISAANTSSHLPLGEALQSCSTGHPNFPNEHYRRTTEEWPLYAWTADAFDSNLPTVLFFNGGPGQSSHGDDWKIPGWNVIFWDQRGVACSKPKTWETYLDQSQYSIEGTARDARKILDLFEVQTASLLAVSYGTAPATVMAHLFPERVTALVLEGTLSNGGRELQDLAHAQKILVRYFNGLPIAKQNVLRGWATLPGITPTWFSRVGYYFLTLNDGLSKLNLFFERLMELDDLPDVSFFDNFGGREFGDDPLGFSAVTFSAIACGELSQGVEDSTAGLIVGEKEILSVEDNSAKALCTKYGFKKTADFLALNYPVQRKITYFQGVLDGATEAPQAIEHFRSVPQYEANLFLRTDGGHSPLLGEIRDKFPNSPDLQRRYLDYLILALKGEDPDLAVENGAVWKHTKKLRADDN